MGKRRDHGSLRKRRREERRAMERLAKPPEALDGQRRQTIDTKGRT